MMTAVTRVRGVHTPPLTAPPRSAPPPTMASARDSANGASEAPEYVSLELSVKRGHDGTLGFDINDDTITQVVPGSEAQRTGYWMPGDKIVAVDGEFLEGREVQEVMKPGKDSYNFRIITPKKSIMWQDPSATKEAISLELEAVRGEDGRLGLVIQDNVIVDIVPSSAAGRARLFGRGDCIIAVDGKFLEPGEDVRAVMEPGKSSYMFRVITSASSCLARTSSIERHIPSTRRDTMEIVAERGEDGVIGLR